MSRSLSPDLRNALSERIRYYREMGVYDFYSRDSAPFPDSVENAALADSIPPPGEHYPEHREPMSPKKSATAVVPSDTGTFEVLNAKPEYAVADPVQALRIIREDLGDCTRCRLHKQGRKQIVFGVGNPDADLMFIGEAPGADEDQQGEPFVGRAGQLLTRILKAMNFAREDVYIANILKCRPDMPAGSFGNRPPTPTEMQTCRPYLVEQITIIQPSVLVALGAVAVEGLLGTRATMRELRGRWHAYNGIPLMITYHPAYLLRNQARSEKRKVWEDMLQVLERLQKPISEQQRNYFL